MQFSLKSLAINARRPELALVSGNDPKFAIGSGSERQVTRSTSIRLTGSAFAAAKPFDTKPATPAMEQWLDSALAAKKASNECTLWL